MVDLQTIGVLVTGASVTIAAIYYIITLRTNQRNTKTTLETRQAQLFMNLYQHTYSPDFGDAVYVVLNKGVTDYEDYESMMRDPQRVKPFVVWGMWIEGVGVLVKEGLVSLRMVTELVGGMILM